MSKTKHGLSSTATYRSWNSMMSRCYSDCGGSSYERYGGRGISVCSKWHNFLGFLEDMGHKPEGYSLERDDPNGDYCPENCRWVPVERQAHNKRSSRFLTHNGITMTLADWGKETGYTTTTIHKRLSAGWPVEKALTTPVRR